MIIDERKISDLEQRQEALSPEESFIVQAPAGSGKTELIIRRFLTLLALSKNPEEILAMTFTRKAAGEMHQRITEALKSASLGVEPKDENEKERFRLATLALKRDAELKWGILENPSRLKVLTIDSLSAGISRQTPIFSRLGGISDVSSDPDELYNEAALRTINSLGKINKSEEDKKKSEALRSALSRADNSVENLRKRLVTMLERRDQWLRHISPDKNEQELRTELEDALRTLINGELEEVKKSFEELPAPVLEDIFSSANYAAHNLEEAGAKSLIRAIKNTITLPEATSQDLKKWQGLGELLLTKGGELRKSGGVTKSIGFPAFKTKEAIQRKDTFKAILDNHSGEEDFLKKLKKVITLPDPVYNEEDWTSLLSLLKLLPLADAELRKLFAEHGILDFQALSLGAIDALGSAGNPTDLMLAYDLRFQHILIDEYQDISRTQKELITLLTSGWEKGDGRTLFIVGDPMQSIYLFREAEVGLFIEARERGIGAIKLKGITLRANFRSLPSIIKWVNDAFSLAFSETEDAFTGRVKYEPLMAVKEEEAGCESGVVLGVFSESAKEREAEAVVTQIIELQKKHPQDKIALLARSRSHLILIVEELKNQGVSFISDDLDALSERPVIKDLFTLVRALAHPFDRVAWLALLRAPWLGISLKGLLSIVSGKKDSPIIELILDKERLEGFVDFDEKERERLYLFTEKIERASELLGRTPPRDLIRSLWIELGGPLCYLDKDSVTDAEAFFDLLDKLSKGTETASLKILEEQAKKLFATHRGEGKNPVEIMTIHKAKGLEFDRVVVPALGRIPRVETSKLLLWMERGSDLLLAPMKRDSLEENSKDSEGEIYKFLKSLKSVKDSFEQVRLFYVAVTRAKKGLYLYGNLIKNKKEEEANLPAERSLLSVIRKKIEDITPIEVNKEDEKERELKITDLKRLKDSWHLPSQAVPSNLAVAKSKKVLKPGEEVEFNWARVGVKSLGTVVHKYFCRIGRDGLEGWNSQKIDTENPRIKEILMEEGLSKRYAETRSTQVVEILKKTLADERGRWILAPHKEGATELALSAITDGRMERVIIDRTFVDDKDIRWVIDYKTSLHEGGSLADFLAQEKERYSAQLEKYSEVLKASGEERHIKKGLYFPALSRWISW
ncbi:MAG: UvrD-helicase domain-containing protein [Deltaproteobacteria bacterium]|nr:UvrD-helicase domain-containing protein [Deltaproteobacteria bacterium]